MRQSKKYFLKIMKIELEDLKDDLKLMINSCEKRKENGELTEHVYLANCTLFQNELIGLNDFMNILRETKINQFETLEELILHLKKRFKSQIKKLGLAEALDICIERKMDKVKQYVTKPSILIEKRPMAA